MSCRSANVALQPAAIVRKSREAAGLAYLSMEFRSPFKCAVSRAIASLSGVAAARSSARTYRSVSTWISGIDLCLLLWIQSLIDGLNKPCRRDSALNIERGYTREGTR